jgi:hypothetical protein
MADRLLPRTGLVDGLQRQGDFDELFLHRESEIASRLRLNTIIRLNIEHKNLEKKQLLINSYCVSIAFDCISLAQFPSFGAIPVEIEPGYQREALVRSVL